MTRISRRLRGPWHGLWQDIRVGARSLARSPLYAGSIVATLALGLSANVLVFAIVHAALLRPLPFPEPGAIAWLWPGADVSLTHERFRALQTAVAEHGTLSAWTRRGFVVTGGRRPVAITGVAVSTNHFDVFGLRPALGRRFEIGDEAAGAEPVALLSDAVWRDWFSRDPDIIGRRVRLDVAADIPMQPGAFTGAPRTVVGVLPPGYRPFGFPVDVITPLIANPADPDFRNLAELGAVARVAGGVSLGAFSARVDAAMSGVLREAGSVEDAAPAAAMTLHEATAGPVRPILFLTLGAVALVLLVACANVAHLSLARLAGRRHECAVRLALGASRWRVGRQFLVDACLLGAIAGGLGVAAGHWLLPAVVALLPAGLAPPEVEISPAVLGYTALAWMVAVLVSWLPTLRSTARLGDTLNVRGDAAGRARHWVHHALVAGESALALAVACTAAVLLHSFARLAAVDPGFQPDGVLTARVAPSSPAYVDIGRRRELYGEILSRVRALPDVVSAGAVHFLPIADGTPAVYYRVSPADREARTVGYRIVTPGYFETMRIPIAAGRAIAASDVAAGPPVGLVNGRLAAQLWPGQDPIGQRLYRGDGREWFEVIGVAGDVRQQAVGVPPTPEVYLPLAQAAWASAMTIVARVRGDATRADRIDAIVTDVDPGLPVTRVSTLGALVATSIDGPRAYGVVFGVFGLAALLLSGIGIYSVAAFTVTQRRREIGIRLALGASAAAVVREEFSRGAVAIAIGAGAGLILAVGMSSLVSSVLFEVSPVRPAAFGGATLLLVVVAVTGTLLPAYRSARLDPMTVVRSDS